MQWRTPLLEFLRSRHIGSIQSTSNTDFYPLRSCSHSALNSHFCSSSKVNSGFKLASDSFRNNICIKLGLSDFNNINLDILSGKLFQLFLNQINFRSPLTDNYTGTRGMYSNGNTF